MTETIHQLYKDLKRKPLCDLDGSAVHYFHLILMIKKHKMKIFEIKLLRKKIYICISALVGKEEYYIINNFETHIYDQYL
jgi:hypothetical protein